MDFKRYLDKAAVELDREVGKIFKEQLIEAAKIDKKLVPLLKAFAGSCQGGKRIRGALVVLGYQLTEHLRGVSLDYARDKKAHLGGEIIKVGAAYEICHSAILAHDDIIDKSPTRRDKPSLYQALRPKDGRVGGNHYGISQAISLADYGFFLSYKIICETDFPCELKIKALNFFSQVMMNTGWGEILDLEDTNPLTTMKLKTACYTIAGPLQMGASLAGADQSLIGKLAKFGENLGIAFQIQDDILDSEIDWIGGLDAAKNEAEKYKNKAMKILPQITKDQIMSKLLKQMAEYLVERDK